MIRKKKQDFFVFLLLMTSLFLFSACGLHSGNKDNSFDAENEYRGENRRENQWSLKFEESENGTSFVYCSCKDKHNHDSTEPYRITQLPFPTFWGGEAYSIITPEKDLYLIDGGFQGQDFERIKAYIDENGGKVKGWILTHPHVDHIGAFIDYMGEYSDNVETVYYSPFTREFFEEEPDPQIYEIINNPNAILFYEFLQVKEDTGQNTEYRKMVTGDILAIGDLTLECFASFSPTRHDVNANSLVFTIQYKDFVLGLTGDMTEATLADIKESVTEDSAFFNTDILQIPHHGYMAGIASDVLYRETKPEYALLDCTIEEYNNNSVNIQEHVKMIESLGIKVVRRFDSVSGNTVWIYPDMP